MTTFVCHEIMRVRYCRTEECKVCCRGRSAAFIFAVLRVSVPLPHCCLNCQIASSVRHGVPYQSLSHVWFHRSVDCTLEASKRRAGEGLVEVQSPHAVYAFPGICTHWSIFIYWLFGRSSFDILTQMAAVCSKLYHSKAKAFTNCVRRKRSKGIKV
jgi:hypothetical protein